MARKQAIEQEVEQAAEAAEQAPARATPEVQTVTMTDGRKVDFVGKRQMLKSAEVDGHTVHCRFDFRNGESRTFTVPGHMLGQFAAHGALQKIGDEAAGEKDVDDMVVACDSVMERLHKGEWKAVRATAGDSFAGASVVIRAIGEVTGKTAGEVKAFLDAKLAANPGLTRRALFASFRNPQSKTGQVIARMEQEKASKQETLHADDLLAELA